MIKMRVAHKKVQKKGVEEGGTQLYQVDPKKQTGKQVMQTDSRVHNQADKEVRRMVG